MNRKENKMGDQHTFDQPLAYEYQRALNILCKSLEAFEGYANKTGRGIRNQIYGTGRWIKDYSGTAWDFQETFLIHLVICGGTFGDKNMVFPVKDFAKKQFYKWIDNTGINVNNCPRDFAHFLIATSDTLNGENKKIILENDRNLESKAQKPSIKVHNETFFEYQKQMDDAEQRKISFGNKTLEEAEIRGLEGDEKKGENIFEEIEKRFRREHNNYYLFSPYNEQQKTPDEGMEVDDNERTVGNLDNTGYSSQNDKNNSNLTKNVFIASTILLGLGSSLIFLYFFINRKSKIVRK